MPVKKTYSKTKDKCKVTFSFPKKARKVSVAGDFNAWDTEALPMKKGEKGFTATVELDADKEYQYRYFVNGERWENDNAPDATVPSGFPDCENCVVVTKAASK
jgi:1,4-alpha-glucan branching enzyme